MRQSLMADIDKKTKNKKKPQYIYFSLNKLNLGSNKMKRFKILNSSCLVSFSAALQMDMVLKNMIHVIYSF